MKTFQLIKIVLFGTLIFLSGQSQVGQAQQSNPSSNSSSGSQSIVGSQNQFSVNLDCKEKKAQWAADSSTAASICWGMKTDISTNSADCVTKLGSCGQPSVADDEEDDSDPADMPTRCRQQLANNLASAKSDDLKALQSANDRVQTAEEKLAQGASSEADREQSDQEKVSNDQEALQNAILNFQKHNADLADSIQKQITAIVAAIAALRTQQNSFMAQRESVIRDYSAAMMKAKKDCADAIKLAAGAQGYQLGSISDLFRAQGAGGLANDQCARDRTYRIAQEVASNDAQTKLDSLKNQYDQANDAIAKQNMDLMNLRSSMTRDQALAVQQLQAMTQKAQQGISRDQQKLQTDQQNYQRTQATLQAGLQRDESMEQQAAQDNNLVLAQTKGLPPGNSAAASKDYDSDLDKVQKGITETCMLNQVKDSPDCDTLNPYACTTPDIVGKASGAVKTHSTGKTDGN